MNTGIERIVWVDRLKGNSPAAMHRKSGTALLSRARKADLKGWKGKFILYHEAGHSYHDTKNEFLADDFALEVFAHKGWPLKEAVKALTKGLSFRIPEHYRRVKNACRKAALLDIQIRGNENARELIKKIDQADMKQSLFNLYKRNLPDDKLDQRPDAYPEFKFLKKGPRYTQRDSNGNTSFHGDDLDGFDFGSLATGIVDVIGGITSAISGDPETKAAQQKAAAVLTKAAELFKSGNWKYPSDWDALQGALDQIPKIKEKAAGVYDKATASLQNGRQAAVAFIQDYNDPKNVATRKLFRGMKTASEGGKVTTDANVLYSVRVLYDEAKSKGFSDTQLESAIKKGIKFGGTGSLYGDVAATAASTSKPAGFIKVEDYIKFTPDDLEFQFPAGKSMGGATSGGSASNGGIFGGITGGSGGNKDMLAAAGKGADFIKKYWWVFLIVTLIVLAIVFRQWLFGLKKWPPAKIITK